MPDVQQFVEVADHLPDAMLLVRQDGTIVAANRSAAQFMGVGAEHLGEKLHVLLDEGKANGNGDGHIDRYLKTCAHGRGPYPGVLHLPNGDHEPRKCTCAGGVFVPRIGDEPALLYLRVLRSDATPGRFIALNERIAELRREILRRQQAESRRRELEAQIQQAQKMESLGMLAGGIAHDFNNLLTSILGYCDLALLSLPEGHTARDMIDQAVQGAQRAAELTKQMLAYSGKGRFVVQPVNITDLVRDIGRLLEVSISKRCVLQYHLTEDLPSCEADITQLRQVLMNLIINASDAIGDRSGVIAVTTGAMHCDKDYLSETYLDDDLTEGLYVFFEIADTGCGMTEETRAKIFDPFFSTKFTGRGLGLAAVLGIVRGHDGAIKVYSEPDKGTTFKVLLPASEQPAVDNSGNGDDSSDWRSNGIAMVVDDEETVRGLTRHMLEHMGFDVLVACDGREAVDIYREHADEVRFVLLDMTMPHMDGEQAFREIRRIRPDVKAILTSGYNEQTATSRFAGKGLAGFIQKPFNYRQLSALVRDILGEAVEVDASESSR